jgi:hypothetical protein
MKPEKGTILFMIKSGKWDHSTPLKILYLRVAYRPANTITRMMMRLAVFVIFDGSVETEPLK